MAICVKTLQVKRGLAADLPGSALAGEVLYTTDTNEVYMGNGSGNALVKVGSDFSNVVTTDGSGKIDTSVLPALAISETYVVADQTAQLALTVQAGDVAVRTDESKSYIALNDTNGAMTDWQELLTPTDSVISVNGKVGTVVLSTDDVNEGATNLYFTNARALSAAQGMILSELSNVSSTAPTNGQVMQYNSTTSEFEPVDLTVSTSFAGLTDTPADYSAANAGDIVVVNAAKNGLEFKEECTGYDGGSFVGGS